MLSLSERKIHTTSAIGIKITDMLNAEPLKAKKRVDPAILKAREDKKKRRIEKEIKKLEKLGKKLKPIDELEPNRAVLKEAKKRIIPQQTNDEKQRKTELEREWTNYKIEQQKAQLEQIQMAIVSQEKALKQLKKDNIDLYNMAIQIDENLKLFKREGPLYTPAKSEQEYFAPEGDYNDTTYLYDRL